MPERVAGIDVAAVKAVEPRAQAFSSSAPPKPQRQEKRITRRAVMSYSARPPAWDGFSMIHGRIGSPAAQT